MSKETIQKDKVDKLQDEFMEFWDSKKDSLGLGEYSDVILQWWLDKISQIEQEIMTEVEECIPSEQSLDVITQHLVCGEELVFGFNKCRKEILSNLSHLQSKISKNNQQNNE